MLKNDPARMAARKLLSTVIPDRVRSAFADDYALELMPADTYGAMLHKRLLQLAETDPEAAALAKEYGVAVREEESIWQKQSSLSQSTALNLMP